MIGRTLDRYTIDAKLGEGGMGVVYKATDTQLSRAVAIKILPHDYVADAARKLRFVQEAKAASALNHPGIVTVHDIRSDAGIDFIVMEYVDGTTLDQMIPEKGLPPARALRYAAAIADAVATAHQAGIIHRDLKPSNIIVSGSDRLKVLDFGLAKLLRSADSSPQAATVTASLTEAGTVVGTTAYMSPEQAEGRELDGRSDIFSLGTMLYEMVTGRRPFTAESRLSLLAKILREEPEPPSRVRETVSPDLEKTILRCLRKDPARRYQTMADLKVALEDLASDSDAAPTAVAASRRRGLPWAAAAAVVAVLVAIVVYATRRPPTADDNQPPQRALPLTSLTGVMRSPSFSPEGNHVAFSWTGQQQDNPDIYVQQIGAGQPLRLTTDPGNDYAPAWSPDGRSVAFLRRSAEGSEIFLVAPLGGAERKLGDVRPRLPVYTPITLGWCPDSRCLVVTDSSGTKGADILVTVDVSTREKKPLTRSDLLTADADGAISPDGRSLVFRRDTAPFVGELYHVPLGAGFTAAGDARRLTSLEFATRPAWMPDSQEIVFSAKRGLWRMTLAGNATHSRLPFIGQDGLSPTIAQTSDGVRLAYVHSFADLNVWRLDLAGDGSAPAAPSPAVQSTRQDNVGQLSPDRRRLAFLSDRSGESEVWVADVDGSNALQLSFLAANPGFPRWSPDGQFIVFHCNIEGHGQVYRVPSQGGQAKILTTGAYTNAFPSYSRDGQWIHYTSSVAGHSEIWKMPADGGPGTRVSSRPGSVSIESYDGRDVYFTDDPSVSSAVWRQPLVGGEPVKVIDRAVFTAFDLVPSGIFYVDRPPPSQAAPRAETVLQFFDFATRRTTMVARNLGAVTSGLSVSRDGRMIIFSRVDSSTDELMLVDDFR